MANIYLSELQENNHKYAPTLHEKSMTSITWADDLLITSLQHDGLQKCIYKLNTHTQKWGLEVSLKKTRCVIFSKGHTKYDLQKSIIIENDIILFETFYKYLGDEMSDD